MACFHTRLFPLLASAALLCSCANSRPELAELREHRVAAPVYENVRRGRKLSESDVVELCRQRVTHGTVIQLLYRSKSQFVLTRGEMNRLERAGVYPDVANFMAEYKEEGFLSTFFRL